jgi:hypothetical protein
VGLILSSGSWVASVQNTSNLILEAQPSMLNKQSLTQKKDDIQEVETMEERTHDRKIDCRICSF